MLPKNVIIITNGTLPIPAFLGGAVENLIATILYKNEHYHNFNFIVFTPFYDKIIQGKNLFKYTQFHYINTKILFYKISRLFRYILNNIPNVNVASQYLYSVKKKIINHKNIDLILIENSPHFLQYFNKQDYKLALHLHNDYISNSQCQNDLLFQNSDLILTVSNYLKNKLENSTTIKLNIKRLYNGIDLNRFNKKTITEKNISNLRSKFNIKNNDYLIAFAGRLQSDKGVELVIDAFLKHKYFNDSKLFIIGSAEFANRTNQKFKNRLKRKILNCKEKIIFTDYIDYTKMHNYFSIPDVFVLPSLCEEAFGMTILESIATSKPVIVSDAGGITEIVNSSCSIILKRDANILDNIIISLEKLFENKELRDSMSISARDRSLNFSDKIYYDNFVKYLNQI